MARRQKNIMGKIRSELYALYREGRVSSVLTVVLLLLSVLVSSAMIRLVGAPGEGDKQKS